MLPLAPTPANFPAIPAGRARSIRRREIKRAAVAFLTALAVGLTSIGTLAVLWVAAAGVVMTMSLLPPTVAWTMAAAVAVGSVALSAWLAYAVWCYQWREDEIA